MRAPLSFGLTALLTLTLAGSAANATTIDPNPFWIFDGAAAAQVQHVETVFGLPEGPAGEPAVVQLGAVGPSDMTLVFQVRLAGPSPDFGALDVTIRDAFGDPIPYVGVGTILQVQTDLEAQLGVNAGNVFFQPVDGVGDPILLDNASDPFFFSFAPGTNLLGGTIEVFDPLTGAIGSAIFVPEPGTLALLLLGAAGLARTGRSRRR